MKKVVRWILRLEQFIDRIWYLPVMGLIAGLDLWIWVVPTDGIVVSSALLKPKKWISVALWIALGSTLGCLSMGLAIQHWGMELIQWVGMDTTSSSWIRATEWMEKFGVWAIFFFAIGPLPVHPGIAIGALGEIPVWELVFAAGLGRSIKYLFLAWLATHAPNTLFKLWGIQKELDEMRVQAMAEKASRKDS